MDQPKTLGAELLRGRQHALGTYAGTEETSLATAHIQYYFSHSYLLITSPGRKLGKARRGPALCQSPSHYFMQKLQIKILKPIQYIATFRVCQCGLSIFSLFFPRILPLTTSVQKNIYSPKRIFNFLPNVITSSQRYAAWASSRSSGT